MTERDDLMLQHLIAIREELRTLTARQLEHTAWLAKLEGGHAGLESGQALLLQMVSRLDDDIQQVKRAIGLIPAAEG
jgi:hypothetical protein